MNSLLKQALDRKFGRTMHLLHNFKMKLHAYMRSIDQQRLINNLKKKDKLNVAFFALHADVWKYEELYRLMIEHPRFEPTIFVCPIVNLGRQNMLDQMDKTYQRFKNKDYNVRFTFDRETGEFLDIRRQHSPDIIFYTNPYKGIIADRYFISSFRDKLTCYVPYAFMNGTQKWAYDNELLNLAWRLFYPNEMYRKTAISLSSIKGSNIAVTGYPIADEFLDKRRETSDPWKIKDKGYKRIIWAPHHSIQQGGVVDNSSFLDNHQLMIDIAGTYINSIQIAFKPHPLLYTNLCNHTDWGKERTDKYYNTWKNLPNGQFNDGDYVDLFLSSDAMIHDCGSFMIEYHYTKKPIIYISKQNVDYLSEFGRLAYDMHYKGTSKKEIINFIDNIVLKGQDGLLKARENFFDLHLLPPNGVSASQNIINELITQIS